MTYTFNSAILREYDIRGTYNETLTEQDAYFIGLKFALWLKNAQEKSHSLSVAVGRDGRLSSPDLCNQLVKGLREGGVDVTDVGIGPTPLVYYSLNHLKTDASIMVTGSHNPPQDNGFKFALQQRPFFGADIQHMAALSEEKEPVKGNYTQVTTTQNYINRLLRDYTPPSCAKKLRIAWDAGNGATGEILEKLVEGIDAHHFLLNTKIDGLFPAHHPDPTDPKNLQQLIQTVKTESCDLGIAFDGDGDRIGVVDSLGRPLMGDQLLTILALDLLLENPSATIITDVKAGQALYDEVSRVGGNLIMWKTGHSLIKKHMVEVKALLAGEMSGHIFYADKYYGYDDGLYAAIRLLNILQKSPYSLSEHLDKLPFYHSTPELSFHCFDEVKFKVVEKLKENLTAKNISFNERDGVRIQHEDGWWLVRASNTQAKLVGRCEANSPEKLLELQNEMNFYLECALKLT